MVVVKKISQVAMHMAIAFTVAYALTGSVAFSGLATIIEPIINVLLLPWHARGWARIQARAASTRDRYARIAGEKVSQTLMHMAVAFGVMYAATGSAAVGGAVAIVEPVCNVLLLPFHDRLWDRLERRIRLASAWRERRLAGPARLAARAQSEGGRFQRAGAHNAS